MISLRHYKERLPEETVTILKKILSDLGIAVVEEWKHEPVIDTYSLRLTIEGTEIGTNGKGITREYARASAYAEFFERLQNGLLFKNVKYLSDIKWVLPEEMLQLDNSFAKFLKDSLKNEEDFMEFVGLEQDKISSKIKIKEYYSMKYRKKVMIPIIAEKLYGSHGMCAGNTQYEALVQGLCEIFERYVMKTVLEEQIALPDIPEEYIMRFEKIYNMFKNIQQDNHYIVKLKDASLGGIYPVVALLIIQKNTGKYGIHFGSHPNFSIAAERAFTEAAQGRKLETFVKQYSLDFDLSHIKHLSNYYNIYGVSIGKYPYSLFKKDSTYKFAYDKIICEDSNEKIFKSLTNKILNLDYDILIHDVSFLGFPSYHIIVPGFSELIDVTVENLRYFEFFNITEKLLSVPSKITKNNVALVIKTLEHYKNYVRYSKLKFIYKRKDQFEYPYEIYVADIDYFLALCYGMIGNFEQGLRCIKLVSKKSIGGSAKEIVIICAMKLYFEARYHLLKHQETMEILKNFFDDNICKEIDSIFNNENEIIKKVIPDDSFIGNENLIEENSLFKLKEASEKFFERCKR